MPINIAICDDEPESLTIIQRELYKSAEKLNIEIETHVYNNGNKIVDLICKDKEDSDIILIFISAHEQYVFESIEYNPFRYIRKSRIEKEVLLALKAAYARLEEMKDSYIVVKTEESEVRVKHSDIMYFETTARKVGIYLNDGEVFIVRKTIRGLSEELNDEHFIKVHSGCVVNARYIHKFSNRDITLDNGIHC